MRSSTRPRTEAGAPTFAHGCAWIGEDGVVQGRVKWFNNRAGWGFIEQSDGPDVYVRHDRVEGLGFKTLQEGDLVEYEVEQGERGPFAVHVTVVGPSRGPRQQRAS